MTDEEKVRRAKDIAARKACEAYSNTLCEQLGEMGITDIVAALAETTHVHTALMVDNGTIVAVRAQWDFTADPIVIQKAIEVAKKFPRA